MVFVLELQRKVSARRMVVAGRQVGDWKLKNHVAMTVLLIDAPACSADPSGGPRPPTPPAGLVPRPVRRASSVFFRAVNDRVEKHTTQIVTTNRGPPDWVGDVSGLV